MSLNIYCFCENLRRKDNIIIARPVFFLRGIISIDLRANSIIWSIHLVDLIKKQYTFYQPKKTVYPLKVQTSICKQMKLRIHVVHECLALSSAPCYSWKQATICRSRDKHIITRPSKMTYHYCDVIMGAMASQVASLAFVYSTVHLLTSSFDSIDLSFCEHESERYDCRFCSMIT